MSADNENDMDTRNIKIAILKKQLRKAHEREKKWQKITGKLASIANSISQYVDEGKIPDNEIEEYKEGLHFAIEYIAFDEK